MFRYFLFLFCIVLTCYATQAQPLYMPRNIELAYKNGTRSPDGMPGKNYWQNRGRYNITITANPPDRTIRGTEQITYVNNSPNPLNTLVFKLIVNIHKPTAMRLRPETEDYFTSGIHIDSFVINNVTYPWKENPFANTWQPVRLPKPLLSHDSTQMYVKWHYDVSQKSNREGMIDNTTYFLAYFYPRVAVLDDYSGWDANEFNDLLEFYSDFNDYNVEVQVPKNYIVWGTGTFQNPDQVLQPKYVQRYRQSLTSDDVINVVTKADLATRQVTAQNNMNTWRFTSSNIPDVAFGISDHFVWDATSVVVDDAAHRRASAQAAYNDSAKDYHYVASYARHSLDWLSHNWPGVPYPYEKSTVFQGYAGMEYPMMANDETYEDTTFSRFVAEHEIAHTYMPFYMGINEESYGFMDEGWATTFELLIGTADMGKSRADEFYRQFRVNQWINDHSGAEDFPIITPGIYQSGPGLGNNEYGKPSLGYLAVKDMLGDDLFKKCLHEYMNRWHGKHPIPWDFFYTFNSASGKNLNWFWQNWFFSNYYNDLAVQSADKTSNGYTITVQNIGGLASPFDVIVTYSDNTKETFHQTSEVWKANQRQATVPVSTTKKVTFVQLDGGIYMDAHPDDNSKKL